MMSLVVNFTVKEGELEKAKELSRKLSKLSEQEPGCRHFICHQSVDDPRRFLFYELYDDQAAIDFHRASPHYAELVKNGLLNLMESRLLATFKTLD